MNIGCHLTVSEGLLYIIEQVKKIEANSFQFFVRNPLGGRVVNFCDVAMGKVGDIIRENNISGVVAHSSYTMNLCSNKKNIRDFSLNFLKEDLINMDYFCDAYYNIHPGCHVGQGVSVGVELISNAIVGTFKALSTMKKKNKIKLLLETMSGKGTEIGSKFEEIRDIMENVNQNLGSDVVGVCFDTCHVFEAGYDIVNGLEYVLEEFDKIIGLKNIFVFHLNDSKNFLGAKKDRHEKIGEGSLGLKTFENLINYFLPKNPIFILETPNDILGYAREISILKSLLR
ncbi:MAG: deoxyribonuclease IV [Candidatus Improbicoccus pseudotrichonymphae]|uniref:Probable endonuclease 4 n=1 Tax=Candidatus Improbicoccus pseudotrichonymphae TaxID=3033792 RepID=A0AA48I4P9_9FIRM|nr:MAG: deoxyribonuclease IV [Candidatus Improbicoccus pseudotrichonymphae]